MDTLANLLVKIQNAYRVHKDTVVAPASKMATAVTKVMVKEGYLASAETKEVEGKKKLVMILKYQGRLPSLERVRRVSRSGRRVYAGATEMPRPAGGFGTIIVSTPAGVMTARDAKKKNLGGEVLCEIIRGA